MYSLNKSVSVAETVIFGISLSFLLTVSSYCFCEKIIDATIATITTLFLLIVLYYVIPTLINSCLGGLSLCLLFLMSSTCVIVLFPIIIKQNDWKYGGLIALILVSLMYITWYTSILNWQQIVGGVALCSIILAIRIAFIADIQNRIIYTIVFMLIGVSMSNDTTHNILTFLITCAVRSIGLKHR